MYTELVNNARISVAARTVYRPYTGLNARQHGVRHTALLTRPLRPS